MPFYQYPVTLYSRKKSKNICQTAKRYFLFYLKICRSQEFFFFYTTIHNLFTHRNSLIPLCVTITNSADFRSFLMRSAKTIFWSKIFPATFLPPPGTEVPYSSSPHTVPSRSRSPSPSPEVPSPDAVFHPAR